MKRYPREQRDLYMVFINSEKTYDRVPKEVLLKVLEKKGFRIAYIQVIKDMYDGVTTSIRIQGGVIGDFPICIGPC